MICDTTRQNETIVNLFHSRFNQEQYSNENFFLTIHIVLVRLLLTSKKKLQSVKYTYHRLHLKTILMKFISQVALEKDLKENKIKQVKNRTEFLYARIQKKLKSYCRVNINVSLTDTFEKLA